MRRLLWFYSSGVIQKIQQELEERKINSLENYLPVELEHTFYIMGILAQVIFISIGILVIELFYSKAKISIIRSSNV